MGVIDEAAIDRLFLITQISKRVAASAADDAHRDQRDDGGGAPGDARARSELANFFPPLLWLLRDFMLELTDAGGTAPLSAAAYMEKALEARPQGARRSDERNDTRAAIRSLFASRSCGTLVRPAASEEDLRNALTSSSLRPEFLEQLDALRSQILGSAPLKRLYGQTVDGSSLVLFATALVG